MTCEQKSETLGGRKNLGPRLGEDNVEGLKTHVPALVEATSSRDLKFLDSGSSEEYKHGSCWISLFPTGVWEWEWE